MHLSRSFFARDTVTVAQALLGQRLVRVLDGGRLSGLIIETEAYVGQEDLACHAHRGPTARNAAMFGPPGQAYVYFTYGMHWMLNIVTERVGFPAAVLIRALEPEEGLETMRAQRMQAQRKQCPDKILVNGPGKLAQALILDRAFDGYNLCARNALLFIEATPVAPNAQIVCGPRIGIDRVPEPWKSIAWNFRLARAR